MSFIREKRYAVAVDAYSSGNFFPAVFRKFGIDLIHVQSTPDLMPSMLAPQFSEFADNIVYSDLAATVNELQRFRPIGVFAGQEPGVPLADALSEAMGLATNGTALSQARRDKYQMIEALRRQGVRCAAQIMVKDVAEVEPWLDSNKMSAFVVKPLQSASTDGVTICKDLSLAKRAVDRVLTSRDIFGDHNKSALIQEYLAGPEYIVDTVSCRGQHFVCGIWRYKKRLLDSGENIYEQDVLVAETDPVVPALASYVQQALDALGIKFGPAHSEIIVTDEGPTLVETGARLNGDMHPGFHDFCLGHNQAELTAMQYIDPDGFVDRYGGLIYKAIRPAVVLHAVSVHSGTVCRINEDAVAAINVLPSVQAMQVKLKVGAELRKTVDLLSSPMRVFLSNPDIKLIKADCDAVRRLQSEVYEIES